MASRHSKNINVCQRKYYLIALKKIKDLERGEIELRPLNFNRVLWTVIKVIPVAITVKTKMYLLVTSYVLLYAYNSVLKFHFKEIDI